MSYFSILNEIPKDKILALADDFKNDKTENINLVDKPVANATQVYKVDLGVGVYKDKNGKNKILDVVKEIENQDSFKNEETRYDYLPMEGLQDFNDEAQKLLFGLSDVNRERILTIQSLSGTGALRIAVDFFNMYFKYKGQTKKEKYWFPQPTYGNHPQIWKYGNLANFDNYFRWYDSKKICFDFAGCLKDLEEKVDEGAVVVFHACAHNPTGFDPSVDQWKEICKVVKKKKLFTLFDCAYQGFATGDFEKDGFAVRHFFNEGLEFIVAQSFAKNFGLYGARVGAVHFVCNANIKALESQVKFLVRTNFSNAPRIGARLVRTILKNKNYRDKWLSELKDMSTRIMVMRGQLYDKLHQLKTPHPSGDPNKAGDWDHVKTQIGMFSFTGLTPEHVLKLRTTYHIYMCDNGRLSIPGLNEKNVQYVANAIHAVVTGKYPN